MARYLPKALGTALFIAILSYPSPTYHPTYHKDNSPASYNPPTEISEERLNLLDSLNEQRRILFQRADSIIARLEARLDSLNLEKKFSPEKINPSSL